MVNVIVTDDQKLLRESFKNIIENNSDMKVIASASNGREAFDLCGKHNPDIVLMDVLMPVCNGIEATKLIKSTYPGVKVLMLSSSNDENDVFEAINNGADGYILKNVGTEELILAIKSALMGLEIIHKDVFKPSSSCRNSTEPTKQGGQSIKVEGIEVRLSEREIQIIEMIVAGKDNKEIGNELFLAEGTVKNAITEIISKLQLKDRTQLAVFAIKNNLI